MNLSMEIEFLTFQSSSLSSFNLCSYFLHSISIILCAGWADPASILSVLEQIDGQLRPGPIVVHSECAGGRARVLCQYFTYLTYYWYIEYTGKGRALHFTRSVCKTCYVWNSFNQRWKHLYSCLQISRKRFILQIFMKVFWSIYYFNDIFCIFCIYCILYYFLI